MALMRAYLAFTIAVSLLAAGCSSDSGRRSAYEAMQNYSQQDCLKDPLATCPKGQSYDDYQRQRKALEAK